MCFRISDLFYSEWPLDNEKPRIPFWIDDFLQLEFPVYINAVLADLKVPYWALCTSDYIKTRLVIKNFQKSFMLDQYYLTDLVTCIIYKNMALNSWNWSASRAQNYHLLPSIAKDK